MSATATKERKYIKVATVERRKRTQPSVAEHCLRVAIVAGLFAGLALSPKLWLSERAYPTTPVSPLLGSIPAPLDHIIYAVLLAMLVAIAAVARPAKLITVFIPFAVAVALFDQSRWQPWFYQYLVMLAAVGLYDRDRGDYDDIHNPALNACRLVVVCTYFWSGLQKTNSYFILHIFPYLMQPLMGHVPPAIRPIMNSLGTIAPFAEAALGIGLLTRRFRTFAIFGACGMHAFILLAIGPFGKSLNNVVWPWNLAMLCFLAILFWQRPQLSAREILWPRGEHYRRIVLVLFGIAPILSFCNLWDSYLSSALYSGMRNTADIYVANALADRFPKEILQHVYLTGKPGTNIINLFEWSMSELNVPDYPEPRIYKNVARHICTYAHQPSEMKLVIKQTNVLFSADREVSYDCPALGK
jgi:hypothetical protein